MRPYVPREDPTQTSAAPTGVETLPPEDPEDVLARLQRTERRKKAVVVVLSLAALMIGVAVMLDRGLVESPNSFSAFDDVELPEVPDLGGTWVGKAIDEAKHARAAEATPRGQMRPLTDQKGAAKPGEAQAQARTPSMQPTAGAEAEDTQQARQEPEAAPASATRQAPRAATRAATSPEASEGKKVQQATGSRTGSRRSTSAPEATQRRSAEASTGAATGPNVGTAAKGPTPSTDPIPTSGTPDEDTEVTVISATDGTPEKNSGLIEIAKADGAPVEDNGFDDDEAAVDPERFRPRRPWPTPTGRPPAMGSVGRFTLVTLPSAEVRFRGHALGSTPLHSQQLPSGRQRLILIGPDGVRRVLILDIHADQTAEVQLPISRLMPEALMP